MTAFLFTICSTRVSHAAPRRPGVNHTAPDVLFIYARQIRHQLWTIIMQGLIGLRPCEIIKKKTAQIAQN